MLSKLIIRISVGLIVIAAFITGWLLLRSPSADRKSAMSGMMATPKVNAIVLVPRPFTESLTLTGSLLANERVEVRPEVNGRVISINFSEGSMVVKGQVLVSLDDAELKARLSRLKAQLALDKNRFDRQAQLKKIDGVSTEDYEAAQAQVSIREAEIAELEAQIERMRIRAPFSGQVGLRNISIGAVISPQTLITTLADFSTLKVEFSAPERFITGFSVGTQVLFKVRDRSRNESYQAVVYAIDPIVDQGTRSLRVRAQVRRNSESVLRLRPGMFAEVTMQLSSVPDALLVPSEAIQPGMSGTTVFVIKQLKAVQTPVEIGGRDATHVRIIKGVNDGDTIATSGLLILKEGMPVQVQIQ